MIDTIYKTLFPIFQFLFGIQDSKVITIDRVALWTFAIAAIALWQLRRGNRTTQANFVHEYTKDFFNLVTRDLIMLFDNGLLRFKVKDIREDDEDEVPQDFPYFEINKALLERLKISKDAKERFKERDVYTAYEIDDELLGHFEDIAYYEKNGHIDMQMVYEGFDWYITTIWENEEVQRYIQWQRGDGDDIYDGFEYIYNKSKSYGKAKENKQWVWVWRLKWWLCRK